MYLNHMIHGSIPTKGKNFTSKGDEKDYKMAVSEPPKMVGPGCYTYIKLKTQIS
jgi:hypothetical protein